MKLPCPHCGLRPVDEFRHGEIPQVPDHLTDPGQRDLDRVWNRTNPRGPTIEAWFHEQGCRRWFRHERDTS